MDPCVINFIRLYKMVSETCKTVLWEILAQNTDTPDKMVNVMKEMIIEFKDDKIPVIQNLKMLIDFWKEHDTTTPVETDFDITSLCKINLFIFKKQKYDARLCKTIKAINDIRNALAHAVSLSISEDQYTEKYSKIREYVDFLELFIDKLSRPKFTGKVIIRKSSKYLNQIDRIHNEYVDLEKYMNLRRLINQWRKNVSLPESEGNDREQEQDKETKKEVHEAHLFMCAKDFVQITKNELTDSNESDLYDKDNVEETLNEIKDIIETVDENNRDLDVQVKKHQRETSKQKEIMKALKISIIKKQLEQTDTKAKVESDQGLENSTESHQNLDEKEKHSTYKLKREIEEVEESTYLQITKFERELNEELLSCTNECKKLLTLEKEKKDGKLKRVEQHYESKVAKHKSMFQRSLPETEYLDQNKKEEKAEIEKQYKNIKAELEHKLNQKKSNYRKAFEEKKSKAELEKDELILKIKQKNKSLF